MRMPEPDQAVLARRAEIAAALLQNGFKPQGSKNRPALATFSTAKAPGPAINMRDQVCNKRNKKKKKFSFKRGRSALGPRFVLMDPVPVRTGVAAKRKAGSAGSVPLEGIPIPRPRPPFPGGNATLADDASGWAQARIAPNDGPAQPGAVQ